MAAIIATLAAERCPGERLLFHGHEALLRYDELAYLPTQYRRTAPMILELRTYTVNKDSMDAFLEHFEKYSVPLHAARRHHD